MAPKNPPKTHSSQPTPNHYLGSTGYHEFIRHLAAHPNTSKEIPSFLTNLLSVVPAAIYHSFFNKTTNKWLINYVSKGIEKLLGYRDYDLIGKSSFKEIVVSNIHHYHLFEDVMVPNNPYFRLTFEFKTAQGHSKWCSDDGILLFNNKGELCGSVGVFVDITDHKEREMAFEEENIRLKSSVRVPARLGGMIGRGEAMQEVYGRILKMCLAKANLVIIGESGTGKELAARAIHDLSNRSSQNFIAVNCSSISENLFESEFFGHKKGAFTGAVDDRKGYLDSANGGTLFLDEIGEIPLASQTKLLRVLDGYGYIPVGSNKVNYSNFRLITATNRNFDLLIRKGLIREDFYYRISALNLHMPPLRKRKEDIPLLVNHFLERQSIDPETLPPDFLKRLINYSWPGNIRELHNAILRYAAVQETELENQVLDLHQVLPELDKSDTLDAPTNTPSKFAPNPATQYESYYEFERNQLMQALTSCNWQINEAAQALGQSRSTFYRKMKKYNLSKAK